MELSDHIAASRLHAVSSRFALIFLPFPSFFAPSSLIRGENVPTEGLSLSIPLFRLVSSHLSHQLCQVPPKVSGSLLTRCRKEQQEPETFYCPIKLFLSRVSRFAVGNWGVTPGVFIYFLFFLFKSKILTRKRNFFFVFSTFSSVGSCKGFEIEGVF